MADSEMNLATCLADRELLRKERDDLRAALAEALDKWAAWIEQEYQGTSFYENEAARIAELRARFLK